MADDPLLDRQLRPLLPLLDPTQDEETANDPDLPLEWLAHHWQPSHALYLLRPIGIIRRWWERLDQPSPRHPEARALLLRLDVPRPPSFSSARAWWPVDVELRWLGIVASSLYVVLEHRSHVPGASGQYVARLLPPALTEGGIVDEWPPDEDGEVRIQVLHGWFPPRIAPIGQEELDRIEYELRQAVAAHPKLVAQDLFRVRPPDVVPHPFGYQRSWQPDPPSDEPTEPFPGEYGLLGHYPIPEKGSDDYYKECLQERSVKYGEQYLVGGAGTGIDDTRFSWVGVVGVARPSPRQVRIALAFDENAITHAEVHAHLALAGEHYLVLGMTFSQLGIDPSDLHLARACPGRIVPLKPDEYRRVSHHLIDRLEDDRPGGRFKSLWLDVDPGLDDALAFLILGHREGDTIAAPGAQRSARDEPRPSAVPCPVCGRDIQSEHRFCGYCGTRVGPS